MLPYLEFGSGAPTLVFLHYFGGSSLEWSEVVSVLGKDFHCVSADLPGFGAASDTSGFTVGLMRDQVCDLISTLPSEQVVLIGHSMSGKVSMVVANQLIDRVSKLVLVCPSPLKPEPVPAKSRAKMLAMTRGRSDAEKYIDDNSASRLQWAVRERAIFDFERTDPKAWSAWMESGSKEDWSDKIQTVSQPTLVIAGEQDKSLGPDVQRSMTMPQLHDAKLETIQNCGHLVPMEKPIELANLIREFIA